MPHRYLPVMTRTAPSDRDTWGGALLAVVFGGWFSTFLLAGFPSFISPIVHEAQLRNQGVATTAVVVARRRQRSSEAETLLLTLVYDAPTGPAVPPQSFHRDVLVSPERYDALSKGAAVPILYARSNPSVSRLALESSSAILVREALMLALVAFSLLGGVGTLLAGLRSCCRLIRFARCGRRINGCVVDCWVGYDSDGRPQNCLAYRFRPPGAPVQLAAAINFSRLEPGDKVLVEYLPRRPAICRLAR